MLSSVRRIICLVALTVVIASCQRDSPAGPGSESDVVTASNATGDPAVLRPQDIVTTDEALLNLGRDMQGGFGGLFRGRDGTVVVWLKDVSRGEQAKDFLMARQNPDVRPRSRVSRSQLEVRAANHTWQELYDWYLAMDAVIGHTGFVRSDMEERRNMIEIQMESITAKAEAETILQELGVPASAVEVTIGRRARSLAKLTDKVRDTIPGGYKVVSEYASGGCTLGVNAWYASGFGHGFVTNSHCTDVFMGLDNSFSDDWWQNTESGSNLVGQEEIDPVAVDSTVISQCPAVPTNTKCRYSDAALVQYGDTTLNNRGFIERTTAGTNTVDNTEDDWKIVETDSDCPWPDICTLDDVTLEFVGMTSGWETGQRDTLNLCTIDAPERDNTKRLVCQFTMLAGGADGDSGAPVFEIDPNHDPEVTLYGLVWGGDVAGTWVVYSRIAWIKSELGGFTVTAPLVLE